jgi:hypothetical protein
MGQIHVCWIVAWVGIEISFLFYRKRDILPLSLNSSFIFFISIPAKRKEFRQGAPAPARWPELKTFANRIFFTSFCSKSFSLRGSIDTFHANSKNKAQHRNYSHEIRAREGKNRYLRSVDTACVQTPSSSLIPLPIFTETPLLELVRFACFFLSSDQFGYDFAVALLTDSKLSKLVCVCRETWNCFLHGCGDDCV